jgi:hypothetical protein
VRRGGTAWQPDVAASGPYRARMARGRHARRSGLLSRLWPRRRCSRVALLEHDVARLRALNTAAADAATTALRRAAAAADTAAAADVRAAAAAQSAVLAELRAQRAEAALTSARDEVVGLRGELVALREELVWAFAEAKVPVPQVVDLRDDATQTA